MDVFFSLVSIVDTSTIHILNKERERELKREILNVRIVKKKTTFLGSDSNETDRVLLLM
jgi:hypothetical protein